MANKLAHACGVMGCPNLAYDSPYCPQHTREKALKDNRQRKRKQANQYYNSTEWRKLSKRLLKEYPVCEVCSTRRSELVHHIIPRSAGGTDSEENLLVVCRSCHERIHHKDKINQRKKYSYENT